MGIVPDKIGAFSVRMRCNQKMPATATCHQEDNMLETDNRRNDFQMQYRHSKGNLHIRARGVFDGNSAHELLALLRERYTGAGRVFVDTSELEEILPLASSQFRSGLRVTPVPARSLFFKGKKGFHLAPDGSRVLIVREKKKGGCCGKCAVCTCGGHCH